MNAIGAHTPRRLTRTPLASPPTPRACHAIGAHHLGRRTRAASRRRRFRPYSFSSNHSSNRASAVKSALLSCYKGARPTRYSRSRNCNNLLRRRRTHRYYYNHCHRWRSSGLRSRVGRCSRLRSYSRNSTPRYFALHRLLTCFSSSSGPTHRYSRVWNKRISASSRRRDRGSPPPISKLCARFVRRYSRSAENFSAISRLHRCGSKSRWTGSHLARFGYSF